MKEYLVNFFRYNRDATLKMINAMADLHDKNECNRLISHLITTQDKWLNRITNDVDDYSLSWFGEVYSFTALKAEWIRSCEAWIRHVGMTDEEKLNEYIYFLRPADQVRMRVRYSDIALQVNYHAIHHRAQLMREFRLQDKMPPSLDYIMNVLEEVRE